MTLDAMHWVWDHSQSKGNARIALLYVADQVRTTACEVRVGQRELMRALNTPSKDTADKAIKAAIALGELKILQAGTGRRPALYSLPHAVGYTRPATRSAPESGAQTETGANPSAPESGAQRGASAPKTGAQRKTPSAPESGAQQTPSAPESGAPPHNYEVEEENQQRRDHFTVCQPLIKALTEAGITVSWGMPPDDLIRVADAVERAGVPAMVRFAVDTQRTRRDRILYARYFVRGWSGLPPMASAQPQQPNGKPPHCGHIDCDPASRLRETEDDNGLRRVHPCPDCHPNTAKGHAA